MIAAKELPHPMPAESLPLAEPAENPAEQRASTESEDRPESAVEEERKSYLLSHSEACAPEDV